MKVQLKLEGFLFGLMDKQIESFHGPLLLHVRMALRPLNAPKWKGTLEEWMVKLVELTEMAKFYFCLEAITGLFPRN